MALFKKTGAGANDESLEKINSQLRNYGVAVIPCKKAATGCGEEEGIIEFKSLDDKKSASTEKAPVWKLREDWPLGFLGFMGMRGLQGVVTGDLAEVFWLVWFVWFVYFFPRKV